MADVEADDGRSRGRLAPVATAGAGLLVGLALVVAGFASDDEVPPEPAAAVERDPLPTGSEVPGHAGAAASAERLAAALDAVAAADGEPCPEDDLVVRWSEPTTEPEQGAWVEPLGPAPGPDDDAANGLVACRGSSTAVAGFQARYDDGRWQVALVPELEDEHLGADHGGPDDASGDDEHAAGPESEHDGATDPDGDGDGDGGAPAPDDESTPDDVPAPEAAPALPGTEPQVLPDDSPWVGLWDEQIEPLASYEPQRVCSPSPKPGALGFRRLVLRAYPDTQDSGISRACDVGGRSEHKEGRAWDWAVDVRDPAERQAAAEVIGWLLATDEHGNDFAMARRLGVMYVIYNGSIWSAHAAADGWRPYVGRSDHTDHVHISFDEAGGLGQTSFWDVPGLDELVGGGFGPTAILPEPGRGIGFEVDEPDADEPPRPAAAPATTAPTSPPSGGGGGAPGAPAPQPAPAPTPPPSPPPAPPSAPPVTLPPVTVPTPPDLGPIDDLICGLLPCRP